MITFTCEHCGLRVSLGDEWAGKQGTCPHCQKSVTVPDSQDTDLGDLELSPSQKDPTGQTDILPAQTEGQQQREAAAGPDRTRWVRLRQRRLSRERRWLPVVVWVAIALLVLFTLTLALIVLW